MLTTRKVAVAGPPSPAPRIRNLVMTPSIGAPPEYGSPLGLVGTVNWTIVQGAGVIRFPQPWFGSLVVRRLPKLTAALPAGASSRADAQAARAETVSFLRSVIQVLSVSDDRERRAVAPGGVVRGVGGLQHHAVGAEP